MKRILIAVGALAVAAAIWAGLPEGELAPADPVAAAEPPAPAAPPPPPAGPPGVPLAQQKQPARAPVPAVDTSNPAWLSMAKARDEGDPRTPPLQHDAALQPQPDPAQLADPKAYRDFERAQHEQMLASFVGASGAEVDRLRTDLERGRAEGVSPEQLAKAEEKIRRIEQQAAAASKSLQH
ncbi:hypothetical protein [Pseudoduganella sp. RAF53_2]|uniref:hypothetical protein n=1 Tax=unclassified Pseudoduganella TaxID=2637179 RepID=UPI003F98687D